MSFFLILSISFFKMFSRYLFLLFLSIKIPFLIGVNVKLIARKTKLSIAAIRYLGMYF